MGSFCARLRVLVWDADALSSTNRPRRCSALANVAFERGGAVRSARQRRQRSPMSFMHAQRDHGPTPLAMQETTAGNTDVNECCKSLRRRLCYIFQEVLNGKPYGGPV
jgi:hypothetical protein